MAADGRDAAALKLIGKFGVVPQGFRQFYSIPIGSIT
jgi:hypothetical protein